MQHISIKEATLRAGKALWKVFPFILGTILLISLATALIPKSFYLLIFSKNAILDSFMGSFVGSISAGNPITSYILGGELLKQGVGLIAVTAFLVSWVTVGMIQFPAEAFILGRKFAILRNLTSFILAILVSITTVSVVGVLS